MAIGEDTWVNFLTALSALLWSAYQQYQLKHIKKELKEQQKVKK